MSFVKEAYLPRKTLVGIGDIKIDDVMVLPPFEHPLLPKGLKKHADLTICPLGGDVAVCAPEAYDYYARLLEGRKVKLLKGEKGLEGVYPYDVAYNCAIVGRKVFCKKDATDTVLLTAFEEKGYKIIDIKQGYAKCSVCPVDEVSAISADPSFISAAKKEGIEVLRVNNAAIKLEGYENGFFGGCAFMLSEKTFVTKGDLSTHPDYEKVKEFLEKRKIEIKCIGEGSLSDFGSFIPLLGE